MFKKLTAKAFGMNNIGRFVALEDIEDMYGYSYTLDHIEQVYYAIRTKEHEYFFTNRAIIHVDKTAEDGMSRLKRYDYGRFTVKDVFLEAAGEMDIECTLQIQLVPSDTSQDQSRTVYPPLKHMTPATMKRSGMIHLDMDVHVDDIVYVRAVYKTFIELKLMQLKNTEHLQLLERSFQQTFTAALSGKEMLDTQALKETIEFMDNWFVEKKELYSNEDFAEIFETNFTPVID